MRSIEVDDVLPLMGRDDLYAAGTQHLRDGARVITFAGRRGVGTTRLALAVVIGVDRRWHAVDLGGTTERSEALARLLHSLGLGGMQLEAVAERLGGAGQVLVLDRCGATGATAEPAVEMVRALVEDLLALTPELVVVASGTAPLGLHDERVVRVPTLDLPPPGETDPALLAATPAVALFLAAAERAAPIWNQAADELVAVAEVCRHLDGLPAAIVLAAARLTLMEPALLLDTMERVGAWGLVGLSVVEEEVARTVALLDEPSRQVLMALAIAEGGATVEAVASMTGGPSGELSQGVVLTALSLLVEVQLAMADRHHGRYGLLSSATGHVVAAHADDPAWQAGRARHTAYHVERARAFARRPHGSPMDTEWLLDHRNRLAALARLREAGNREGALRLAVDCMPGFLHRSESEDGRRLLAEVLSQTPERTSGACISAHVWLGRLEAERADGVRTIAARAHFETALRLARERGNLIIHLEVLNAIAENQVTLEDGVQLCEEAVAEALALTEAPELAFGRAVFLNWHGGNLHRRGELAEAARCIGEAIDIARSYGDRRLLMSFAIFHWQLPEEVRRDDIGVPALSEVLEMAVEQGDLRTQGWVYIFIVGNCIEASDDQGAVARGLEMARLARRTKQAPIARQLLVSMVRLLVDHSDPALRVRLAAVLASHAEMTAAQLPPRWVAAFDAALASAHEELGEDGFGSAWRAGLATSVWAALDLAEERLEELRTAVAPTESLGGGSAARVHRRRAAAAIGAPRNGAGATLDSLTPRERDVLDGLVRGGSNKEIARDLGMRPKTVAHHCAAIYAKLEVRNRTEAVREALRTTPVR